MKFKEDNKIVYGQDFGWHVGVPSDVDFEVENIEENRMTLVADGYGRLEKKNAYGNGNIFIYLKTDNDFGSEPKIKTELTKNTIIKKLEEIVDLLKVGKANEI